MIHRKYVMAVALGGLLVNAGCGGSSTPSSPSAPAPTPVPVPVTTVVTTGQSGINARGSGVVTDFSLASPGTVRATLRWTFASSDVDVWVLSGTACNTQVNGVPTGAGCTILCQDIGTSGTSATCSFAATAGTFRVWGTNYGSQNESGTFEVTVTR